LKIRPNTCWHLKNLCKLDLRPKFGQKSVYFIKSPIVELRIYAFAINFPLYVPLYPKMVLRGFPGEHAKILCSNPRKALPCVNVRLLCWCITCQNWFNSLNAMSMDRFCIQRNEEKMSGNFGYMGRSTPWDDLE